MEKKKTMLNLLHKIIQALTVWGQVLLCTEKSILGEYNDIILSVSKQSVAPSKSSVLKNK